MSLSPSFNSLVATLSFSFTTGTAPSFRLASRAFLAFTYRSRVRTSSADNSNCATGLGASARSQSSISSVCPTAAAACLSGRVRGSWIPRRSRPAAPAPEDTSTALAPQRPARTSMPRAIAHMRGGWIRPASSVRLLVPTLTTMRRQ